jgi:hypothetical protein
MKPVDIGSSIGLDRLATRKEIICAISVSDGGTFAPVGDIDDLREANADFSIKVCNLPEDDVWLAIAREEPDSPSN